MLHMYAGLVGGCLLLSTTMLVSAASPSQSPPTVQRLRCEYLVNPLGIDRPRPRLSWNVVSTRRGELQSAYQVLAASTAEKLAAGQGDLWDSGKRVSDVCIHLPYGGRELTSGERVHWKVRVWYRDGQASGWSEPAWFEMGLLRSEDWKGQWLAAQPEREQLTGTFTPEKMQWIWWPEADPQAKPPKNLPRYFRRTFQIPADRAVNRALLLLTVDDHYVLYCNGQEIGSHDAWQMMHVFDVSPYLRPGTNVLAIVAKNYGDAAGVIGQLHVAFDEGEPLQIVTDTVWKCSDRESSQWHTARFDDSSWSTCRVVGTFNGPPWGKLYLMPEARPAPLLRRTFTLAKPVHSARAYICGLGYHEMHINGQRIGDHVLDPAFTDYNRRALYVTHDITRQLKPGENAIGVILGTGWYNMHAHEVWEFDKAPWRDAPCLKMQIEVSYADGSRETIATDDAWRVTTGPILYDCIRVGEIYDARLEKPGWTTATFNDQEWARPLLVRGPRGRLVAQQMDPIRITKTIKPVAITEPKPGVYVLNTGQNLTGWCSITVRGEAGTPVEIIHGERLNPDGTVSLDKIREHSRERRFQTDVYILKGQGEEVHEPRFAYHGFQYVELRGWPGKPSLDDLQIRVLHTDCPQIGSFACSNELFNQIRRLTIWSYYANFMGYPTDCPHREKNGWTGDAHMAARQAMYQFDNAPAYTKWIDDMADAMRDDASLPGIVPTGGWGYTWGNGPAWDSAYLLIPWYLYLYNGDSDILLRHYDNFKRYVDYLTSRAEGHIVSCGLGDWVPLDQTTPEAVTSTAYYYVDARIVAEVARLRGDQAAADHYTSLAADIRKAFNEKFVDSATGKVATGSQTSQATALYQGLARDEDAPRILAHLVANIERCDGHINSGVLGSIYIPHALTRFGRPDVAYRIAAQTTFPSWGHWLKQGANTLWEDWKGEASLNHIFFGDINAWFYETLAGIQIDPDQPGYKHIILRPYMLGDLTHAEAEVLTVRGKAASSWRIAEGELRIKATIPAGSTATVWVPGENADQIRESGGPAQQAENVHFLKREQQHCLFKIGSGEYEFITPTPKQQN